MPLISSIHFSTVIVAIVGSFHERRTGAAIHLRCADYAAASFCCRT